MVRWAAIMALLGGGAALYGFTGAAGVATGIFRSLALVIGLFALFLAALHLTRRRRGRSTRPPNARV